MKSKQQEGWIKMGLKSCREDDKVRADALWVYKQADNAVVMDESATPKCGYTKQEGIVRKQT